MPHSLRDLACVLPLFYLRGTSFLPEMWEVSPPQIWGRLRRFVPWMAGADPAAGPPLSSMFLPQRRPTPSPGRFPGTLLLVEEFQSLHWLEEDQTAGRQWFPSAETKEFVFYLRISVSFQTVFPTVSEEMLVYFFVCLFFCFVLTCFRVGDVLELSLLQTGNRWFCFCAGKVLFLEKLSLNRIKTFLQ